MNNEKLKQVLSILKEIENKYDDYDITHMIGDIEQSLYQIDNIIDEQY